MVNKVQILQKLTIIHNDKVLILRRSLDDKSRPGTWDFVGGNVDDSDIVESANDILVAALKREVQEELSLDLEQKNIKVAHIDSGYSPEGHLVVWIGYVAEFEKEPSIKLSHEHSTYKWVTQEEFMQQDFGYAKGSMTSQINSIWT